MAIPVEGGELGQAVDEVLEPVLAEHRRRSRLRWLSGWLGLMASVVALSFVVFGEPPPWPELLGFGLLGAFCAQGDPERGPRTAPEREGT